jgi:signal transduction histidine kinase
MQMMDDSNPYPEFNSLQIQERERIKAIRLNDLRQIQTLSAISLLPLAFVSFMLGYWMTGRFLKPINNLSDEIEKLSSEDLGKTIKVEVDDEVGNLIEKFNDLSIRLKDSFTAQEQFVQDASHELKTPLTIIQTNLDTVLDDQKATNAELRKSIENSLNGVKELRDLTKYLLDLSNHNKLSLEKTDINEILLQQVSALQGLAEKNNAEIKLVLSGKNFFAKVDRLAMSSAFYNIIENAIKYAKANPTIVNISLKKVQKKILVTIADNGVGIPVEYQAKIFERFYRIDKSRSKKNSGYGLGLAIAKKTVENHKGNLTLSSQPGDTRFIINLPAI